MNKCKFCKTYDFAIARTRVDEDGAVIETALCNTKFPKEEQFNFCPVCGRDLRKEIVDIHIVKDADTGWYAIAVNSELTYEYLATDEVIGVVKGLMENA